MNTKKYTKNLQEFVKEEDTRQKLTVLISDKNKTNIKKRKINASRLFDAFLSDFFDELEKSEKPTNNQQSTPPNLFPTAHN